jgi:hypothetical protein
MSKESDKKTTSINFKDQDYLIGEGVDIEEQSQKEEHKYKKNYRSSLEIINEEKQKQSQSKNNEEKEFASQSSIKSEEFFESREKNDSPRTSINSSSYQSAKSISDLLKSSATK